MNEVNMEKNSPYCQQYGQQYGDFLLQIRLKMCAVWGPAFWEFIPILSIAIWGAVPTIWGYCNMGILQYGEQYLQYGYIAICGLYLQHGDYLQYGDIAILGLPAIWGDCFHFTVQYGNELLFKIYQLLCMLL